jgi:hypothetical protein
MRKVQICVPIVIYNCKMSSNLSFISGSLITVSFSIKFSYIFYWAKLGKSFKSVKPVLKGLKLTMCRINTGRQ